MYNYDLYTGEPSYDGSPSSPPEQMMSEQEIVNNANMMYDFDPNMRYQQMQQQQYGGGYGYGYGYQQPQQFMNPPSGFSGYRGNPVYQYIQNGYGYQAPQGMYMAPPQDQMYYIKGYNPSNTKLLLPSDAQDRCTQMQMQMEDEMEEDYMNRLNQQYSYYNSVNGGYGYNYYSGPYVQPYNPSIYNRYYRQVEDMRKEAEQNRVDLNKHLSKLCHNYLNDDVTDEDIDMIYDGYSINIPGTYIQDTTEFNRLAHAVPVDTSIPYRQHDAEVKAQATKYFRDDMTMNEFFKALGPARVDDMMEEEKHRRRNLSSISMPTSTYRDLIRRKVNETSQTPSFTLPDMNAPGNNIPFGQAFPTLNESARLLDDGTLSIHAPAWLGNKSFAITNVNEDEYEKHRHDFVNSIYGTENPYIGGAANGG